MEESQETESEGTNRTLLMMLPYVAGVSKDIRWVFPDSMHNAAQGEGCFANGKTAHTFKAVLNG